MSAIVIHIIIQNKKKDEKKINLNEYVFPNPCSCQ